AELQRGELQRRAARQQRRRFLQPAPDAVPAGADRLGRLVRLARHPAAPRRAARRQQTELFVRKELKMAWKDVFSYVRTMADKRGVTDEAHRADDGLPLGARIGSLVRMQQSPIIRAQANGSLIALPLDA